MSGTITVGGQPLAGVAVTAVAPSARYTATTDAKGFFSIVGAQPDTYTVTFARPGYLPLTVTGVTVNPTQTTTVNQTLATQLKSIGSTTARAAIGAFQPQQPIDTYSVNSAQMQTLLGKPHATSETALLITLPGATLDKSGYPVLRGGRENDEGFQFEGIDYTDAFTNQFVNNLQLNGVSNFQLTPGAGDASLGNTGTGAINATVKRGTRPAFGSAEIDEGSPNYLHFVSTEYGWATPNGRLSNYTTFDGTNSYVGGCGRRGTDANYVGCQLVLDASSTRDAITNFVFRFGQNNSQSLQAFYQNEVVRFTGNTNFPGGKNFRIGDPVFDAVFFNPNVTGFANNAATRRAFAPIIALEQGQSYFCGDPTGACVLPQPLNRPAETQIQPNETMKLQYSNAINQSTFLTAKFYKVNASGQFDYPYQGAAALAVGSAADAYLLQGGQRTGAAIDITKQLGSKHLIGFGGKYEFIHPIDSYQSASYGFLAALGGPDDFPIADFLPPSVGGSGYLAGFFGGQANVPRFPSYDQNPTIQRKDYAYYLSDQFQATDKLKITAGLRVDGTSLNYPNIHDGAFNVPGGYSSGSYYPIATGVDALGNPDPTKDVYADIGQYKRLNVLEPRFAFAYQFTPRDSITFSYGRSTQLPPISFVDNHFPTAPFLTFAGIPQNPAGNAAGTGVPRDCGPTADRVCRSYADQLYWDYQNTDGIPYTPAKPSTFSNFDASYQHDFGRGLSAKISPFYRRGYDVLVQTATQKIINGAPAFDANNNPILNPSVTSNAGVSRTTGVEFYLTKTAAYGLSGSLSLTYINEFSNVIPGTSGEDFFPSIPPPSLALGNLYRVGFISPFNGTLAFQYKFRSGFRVNPIIGFNVGYPYGAGLLTAAQVNGNAYNVPQTNVSIQPAIGGPASATQYVDPANPGSIFHPNIAARRGTPESNSAGGTLTNSRVNTANISFEYNKPGTRNTFGVLVTNVFGNVYGLAAINARYQPVATGISGPRTGTTANAATLGENYGYVNYQSNRFGTSPYLITPNAANPTAVRAYYQLTL